MPMTGPLSPLGGSAGTAPRGPHDKRGKKKPMVYLAQGKQNKMCAFVNM